MKNLKNPFLIEQLPVYRPDSINHRIGTVGRGRFIMQNSLYASFNQAVQGPEQMPASTLPLDESSATQESGNQSRDVKGKFTSDFAELNERAHSIETARYALYAEEAAQRESAA